jgi:hypothetical protein
MWVVAFALSILAGWLLARALTRGAFPGPRWISLSIEASLGALFGPGLASVLYFFLAISGASANAAAILAALLVLLAIAAVVWWKMPSWKMPEAGRQEHAPANKFPWTWALLLLAGAGLALFLSDFQAASAANPSGEWDALSIWNLRAHYLAGGPETWRRAVTAELGGHLTGAAHPGYPLFLSGFLALQFVTAGDPALTTIPIAASLLFSLAAFLLLGSGLASKKSVALGAMGWLILLCSEVFASQAASQYSDLLQGLAFLAALILLDRAADLSPGLLFASGLALGLAAWIKNEGLPFALAGLAVAAWRFRGRAVWAIAGSVPGLLALAVLKLFIAQGRELVFPNTIGEMLAKLAMPGRWWQALLGFAKAIIDAGDPWAHPVILGAALALTLGFIAGAERRKLWPLWIPVAATAAAEYGLYLITTADLDWHISTSVSRLLAQLWPPLIWLVLSMTHTPEEYFPAPEVPMPAAARGRKKA